MKTAVAPSMSQSAIAVLAERGYTLTDIARMLGVTKSYISRVRSGERSFTLDHMAKLQQKSGEKIPLLILESIPRDTVPRANLPLYEAALKMARDWHAPTPWNKQVVAGSKSRNAKSKSSAA